MQARPFFRRAAQVVAGTAGAVAALLAVVAFSLLGDETACHGSTTQFVAVLGAMAALGTAIGAIASAATRRPGLALGLLAGWLVAVCVPVAIAASCW